MLAQEKDDHEDLRDSTQLPRSTQQRVYAGSIPGSAQSTGVASHGKNSYYLSSRKTSTIKSNAQRHSLRMNAASCRRLTFSHFADEGKSDDGEYNPLVPRYNTQKYRAWKQECLHFCVTSKVVSIFLMVVAEEPPF